MPNTVLERVEEKLDGLATDVRAALIDQAKQQGEIDLAGHRLGALEADVAEVRGQIGELSEKTGVTELAAVNSDRKRLEKQLDEHRGFKRGVLMAVAAGVIVGALGFLGGLAFHKLFGVAQAAEPTHQVKP